ncbi:hypothetical protein Trydic_g19240 [Trypoxylus dichotomus]
MIKLAKESNHLTFLYKARQFKIVPKAIEPKELLTELAKHWLGKGLTTRPAKIRITQECEDIKQKIEEIINEEDFTNICAAVQRSYTRINGQLKDNHRKTLESLIRQKESNSVDSRKTVINLFSKQLDNNAIKILNKGMKFAIAPTRVPTLDMMLAVEMAAGKIQPREAAAIEQ